MPLTKPFKALIVLTPYIVIHTCQVSYWDTMSVILSHFHIVILSQCHTVTLSQCHTVTLSYCHIINCKTVTLSLILSHSSHVAKVSHCLQCNWFFVISSKFLLKTFLLCILIFFPPVFHLLVCLSFSLKTSHSATISCSTFVLGSNSLSPTVGNFTFLS